MNPLLTEGVNTTFTSSSPSYPSGPNFQIQVPPSTVTVLKPLTYDFRVAEYVDDDGNVKKVGLQVQVWEHTNYGGSGSIKRDWTDVPRVQLPFIE
jgi:hypothetical protein